ATVAEGFLKQYQLDRFLAFTNPDLDPRVAGYNTEQARIAVGNGGLFAQGLFHGSQTQSGFVPAQHADCVFTVAGGELGLPGARRRLAARDRRSLVVALLLAVRTPSCCGPPLAEHHRAEHREGDAAHDPRQVGIAWQVLPPPAVAEEPDLVLGRDALDVANEV